MISSFRHKVLANQNKFFFLGGGGDLFFEDCLLFAGIVPTNTREKRGMSVLSVDEFIIKFE